MIETVKVGLSIADNLFEQMDILLETYWAAHTTVFGRFGCLVIDFDRPLEETETVPAPLVPAVPPVPDAKSVDPESERRLTNLLKQLGAQHERTPEPIPVEPSEPSELKKLEEAERDRVKQDAKKLAEAENKAAEELEKKAAAEEKQKRIVELRELRDGILKARNNPGFMLAAATNPTFARDGNQALRDIAAELDMLEDRLPAKSQSPQFDPEAYDRRRAAAEELELTARM